MKVDDILLEKDFSEVKSATGYHDTFLPVNLLWLDGLIHFMRYEEPFKSMPNIKKFSAKVENYFNAKYGNMVYHKGDDKSISKIINSNWTKLQTNPTIDQLKQQIKFTNSAIKNLLSMDIIAKEGQHDLETDFWLDQRNKDDYMKRKWG